MQRKITWLIPAFISLFFLSCGENGPDCFQTTGDRISEELVLPAFRRIIVFENVRLVIRQGPEQLVRLETGSNLRADVSAAVNSGVLELRNTNSCNLFREYGQTTFYVTSPDLTEIRSSSGLPIRSDGTLGFTDLRLISESFNLPEAETTDGSFELSLDTQAVSIVANGISYYNLSGQTASLDVTIAAGDSRVEAENLEAGSVSINHRGSNEILVNPQNQISGIIRGYGDVLSYSRPPEISVEETFRGRLIFVD
ncbi:head GIN domain-containing protein [Robiginitalea sp. IMCC43444]|uniref:head GIN domain-containing protein n=1 Tax=Robiginitalea sp. IMCC43444 TaxID=3459121 RepID=UPI00404352EB